MAYLYVSHEEAEALKDNFSTSPSYIDLVTDVWRTIKWYFAPKMWHNYVFPDSFIDDFTRHFYFDLNEIYYIFIVAFLITLIRYIFERYICKVCSLDREREKKRNFFF